MVDLLGVRSDEEMLNDLGALLFGDLVDVPEEGQQRVEIEKLEDAFAVLVDTLDYDLVDLGVALAQIAGLVRVLVHTLDDRVEIFLRLNLQNVVRVVSHAFLLLIDRLKKVRYLLDGNFVLILNRLDHALLEQLSDTPGQRLEALDVAFEHLAFAA